MAAEQLTRNDVDRRYGWLPPSGQSVSSKDRPAALDGGPLPAVLGDAQLMSMSGVALGDVREPQFGTG